LLSKYRFRLSVLPRADIYEELESIDPDSVEHLGLRDLALKKKAEAEARRAAGKA